MNFRRGFQRRFTGSRIDAAPLNWRRGLFRLWLLVSAAWIMGWAVYVILSVLGQEFKTAGDFLAIAEFQAAQHDVAVVPTADPG